MGGLARQNNKSAPEYFAQLIQKEHCFQLAPILPIKSLTEITGQAAVCF
jgi:hypothetical protein